jgi:hypothetical protein
MYTIPINLGELHKIVLNVNIIYDICTSTSNYIHKRSLKYVKEMTSTLKFKRKKKYYFPLKLLAFSDFKYHHKTLEQHIKCTGKQRRTSLAQKPTATLNKIPHRSVKTLGRLHGEVTWARPFLAFGPVSQHGLNDLRVVLDRRMHPTAAIERRWNKTGRPVP